MASPQNEITGDGALIGYFNPLQVYEGLKKYKNYFVKDKQIPATKFSSFARYDDEWDNSHCVFTGYVDEMDRPHICGRLTFPDNSWYHGQFDHGLL